MGQLATTFIAAAALGLIAGVTVAGMGFSALRGFISVYGGVLAVVMVAYLSQAPLVLALLGTLVIAAVSFVPATGGYVAGSWLAKAKRRQTGGGGQDAP